MAEVALDMSSIEIAACKLEEGKLVAFPTETVYGLGADAENPEAVARIYKAKGRPSNHPVIVHLAPEADIGYWVAAIPPEARRLIDACWPGPLTLILKRAAHIPDAVSGGQDSIGLRCPAHPVAQALLRVFKTGKGGVAAPSANKFGHVSPTTAQHVRDEFEERAGPEGIFVLDGGQSEVGIESTILDLSRLATHGPVLLRPGQISMQRIAEIVGRVPAMPDTAAPRASGTLEAHYAPSTPVVLVESGSLLAMTKQLVSAGRQFALIRYLSPLMMDATAQLALPENPDGYAHHLYAALRTMDSAHTDLIVIETPPQGGEWQGVNDRLRRAAHDSLGVLTRLLRQN